MQRTPLRQLPEDLPDQFRPLVQAAAVYDSSCSPQARVLYLDRDGGYYLKCAEQGQLALEARMARFYHAKGLGPEVLDYVSSDRDWLLTAAVPGEDCIAPRYLEVPKRLSDTIALELRKLHETDYTGCPVPDRTGDYVAAVEQNRATGRFEGELPPDSFGFRTADEAYAVFSAGKDALRSKVLLHGDYCLPNILLQDWALSGFIDVGCGGVGDRHIDLFWGAWTLWWNLKTDQYRSRFFDAYGRDALNEPLLEVIAAAEVFG